MDCNEACNLLVFQDGVRVRDCQCPGIEVGYAEGLAVARVDLDAAVALLRDIPPEYEAPNEAEAKAVAVWEARREAFLADLDSRGPT